MFDSNSRPPLLRQGRPLDSACPSVSFEAEQREAAGMALPPPLKSLAAFGDDLILDSTDVLDFYGDNVPRS
jgi:hypothetical protein